MSPYANSTVYRPRSGAIAASVSKTAGRSTPATCWSNRNPRSYLLVTIDSGVVIAELLLMYVCHPTAIDHAPGTHGARLNCGGDSARRTLGWIRGCRPRPIGSGGSPGHRQQSCPRAHRSPDELYS